MDARGPFEGHWGDVKGEDAIWTIQVRSGSSDMRCQKIVANSCGVGPERSLRTFFLVPIRD